MKRNFRLSALLLPGCLLLGGCFGSGRPEVTPVRGKVTYRSKPVAEATVAFLCDGAPRVAAGVTDADGNYTLTTFERGDGAMVGTHKVTVTKFSEAGTPEVTVDSTDPKDINKAIEQSMRQSAQVAAEAAKSGSGLPAKYAHMHTTDLKKDVVDGENVIDIELTD
jgi:hypothetical protein